jgi:hypothetical protein
MVPHDGSGGAGFRACDGRIFSAFGLSSRVTPLAGGADIGGDTVGVRAAVGACGGVGAATGCKICDFIAGLIFVSGSIATEPATKAAPAIATGTHERLRASCSNVGTGSCGGFGFAHRKRGSRTG